MLHLGDDCRKMTPSTYRTNTTSTIPLLRIHRVLSHSRWEYRISCRIFFTYMVQHVPPSKSTSEFVLLYFFFADGCSFRKGHLRYLNIFKLQHLQPPKPKNPAVNSHVRTWHSQRMLARNCGRGQAAFGLQSEFGGALELGQSVGCEFPSRDNLQAIVWVIQSYRFLVIVSFFINLSIYIYIYI